VSEDVSHVKRDAFDITCYADVAIFFYVRGKPIVPVVGPLAVSRIGVERRARSAARWDGSRTAQTPQGRRYEAQLTEDVIALARDYRRSGYPLATTGPAHRSNWTAPTEWSG